MCCRVGDPIPGGPQWTSFNVMYREDWLIEGLDTWLGAVFSSDNVEEMGAACSAQTEPSWLTSPAGGLSIVAWTRQRRRSWASRMCWRQASTPHLAATWMDEAQKVVAEAWTEQALMGAERAGPTRRDLRALVTGFSSLTSRLGQVPAAVRAEIYAPLGVRATYNPASASVEAEASRSHEMLGKTWVPLPAPDESRPPSTRVTLGR
jgi:hypothetical protein